MYLPDCAVRIELVSTDIDPLMEWRVTVGGTQRGGMSIAHGYVNLASEQMANEISRVVEEAGTALSEWCAARHPFQLGLALS